MPAAKRSKSRTRTPVSYETRLILPSALIAVLVSSLVAWKSALGSTELLAALVGSAVVGAQATVVLVPRVAKRMLNSRVQLFGYDINKPFVKDPVPEALGLVPGMVYIALLVALQAMPESGAVLDQFNAGLTSVTLMLLCGFVDDVLDLRWAAKIALSALAVCPVLATYSGSTWIVLPTMLHDAIGTSINLGYLYHLYMFLFAVFCTNSINIYAGINGLEVGQSIVIGCAVLVHALIQLQMHVAETSALLLSVLLVVPFIAVSAGLYAHNSFPSKVFVGDSYTYFAGQVIGMIGILGHFPKTLALFFLPQLLNFALSLPQLLRIVPCPKHRVPKYDEKLDKLVPSPNYTVINAWLWLFGPKSEGRLTNELLVFQAVCCLIGFGVRYRIAPLLFSE